MQPTKKLRALLIVSGLLAMAIGGSILFTPAAFYAANGILGFYRGCGPTLARTACGQAVALSVYDWASRRAR